MPSPRSLGRERLFNLYLRGDTSPTPIRAENKDKARATLIRRILGVRGDLDFKLAAKLIERCELDPTERLPVGRPRGKGRRKPRDTNDHSVPHW